MRHFDDKPQGSSSDRRPPSGLGSLWDDIDSASEPSPPAAPDPFGRSARRGSLSSWWTSRFGRSGGSRISLFGGGGDAKVLRVAQALQTAGRIGRLALGERSSKEFSFNTRSSADVQGHHHVAVDVSAVSLDPEGIKRELGWDEGAALDAVVGSALAEGTLATFAWGSRPLHSDTATDWRRRACTAASRVVGPEVGGDFASYLGQAMMVATDFFRDASAHLAARHASRESFPGFDGYFDAHARYLQRPDMLKKVRKALDEASSEELGYSAHALAVLGEALSPGFIQRPGPEGLPPPSDALQRPGLAEAVAAELLASMEKAESITDIGEAAARAAIRLKELFNEDKKYEERVALTGAPGEIRLSPENTHTGLNDSDQEKAEKMAQLDLRDETKTHGFRQPAYKRGDEEHVIPVWSARAPSDSHTAQEYLKSRAEVMPLVNRTRRALAFRNEQAFFDERPLRSGQLDAGSTHRLALGELTVFARREIEELPSVVVGVLVDESGSMSYTASRSGEPYKDRLDVARDCAVLLHEALRHERGVTLKVWGHDSSFGAGAMVYRYEEPRALGHIGARAANLDGAAIGYCVEELRRLAEQQATDGKPAQAVLFVLCDGYPDGYYTIEGKQHYYTGVAAYRHTREAVELGRRRGLEIIGLGMGDGLEERHMSRCFGPGGFELVRNATELPARLQRALLRSLGAQG